MSKYQVKTEGFSEESLSVMVQQRKYETTIVEADGFTTSCGVTFHVDKKPVAYFERVISVIKVEVPNIT
jgi:hypothetical protein